MDCVRPVNCRGLYVHQLYRDRRSVLNPSTGDEKAAGNLSAGRLYVCAYIGGLQNKLGPGPVRDYGCRRPLFMERRDDIAAEIVLSIDEDRNGF
jgi:hypothetical protein